MVKWAEFFEVSTSGYYIWKSQCTARQRWEEQYRHSVRKAFESGEDPCNSFLGDWEKGTGDNVYLNEMLKQVIHTIKYRNNMKVIDIDITYR